MGIRFFCPKGHKLHVKAFQAGKKGVCPDCGSRFVIPMESQRVSSKERKQGATADPATTASATSHAAAATHAIADKATAEAVDDDAEPVEIQIAEDEQDETAVSTALPPTSGGPASGSSSSDPITEAPNAIWYVRPASGGQYGPARGEIMRRWLGEGRVASDSMVWREGWSDWKTANAVFPELNKQGSSKTSTTAVAGVTRPAIVPQASALASPDNLDLLVSSGSVPSSVPAASRMPAKSRGKNSLTIWIVVGLTLVVVLLTCALIYVLQRR